MPCHPEYFSVDFLPTNSFCATTIHSIKIRVSALGHHYFPSSAGWVAGRISNVSLLPKCPCPHPQAYDVMRCHSHDLTMLCGLRWAAPQRQVVWVGPVLSSEPFRSCFPCLREEESERLEKESKYYWCFEIGVGVT